MYKRKLLAALLLLALGLSGCGNAAPSVPESNASSTDSAQTEVPEPTLEERQLASAKEYTENLTLEEQVSQLFFARCPDVNAAGQAAEYSPGGFLLFGRDFDGKTADEVKSDIAAYKPVGGLIYFAQNLEDREQVTAMLTTVQTFTKIPLFLGTDEEGGTVVRVSSNPLLRESRFASPQRLYAEGGLDRIRSDTAEKDALLLSLGVNVNRAPVCDISSDSASFIYPRTLGGDATETSDFVRTVVQQMKTDRVGMVLKHFPGYGGTADTHTGQAVDERPLSAFQSCDLLPFEAGIDEGAQAVLVSHNIVTCMDTEYPASLSPAVHELLRGTLGFTGVVMTDDLAMNAVTDFTGAENAAVLAVKAGNDMMISSDFVTQRSAVLDAVQNGTLEKSDIEQAAERVILWKIQLGLIPCD